MSDYVFIVVNVISGESSLLRSKNNKTALVADRLADMLVLSYENDMHFSDIFLANLTIALTFGNILIFLEYQCRTYFALLGNNGSLILKSLLQH